MRDVPFEFVQAGGYVGPTFTSVFYFQNVFWRMVIPIVFGKDVRVNILDSLAAMPLHIRKHLARHEESRRNCMLHWADCLDYDQGIHEVYASRSTGPAMHFIRSLDRDLRTAIADLVQSHPNLNAMHSARLTTEKALKAYLCSRHGYAVEQVKRFGHDIAKLAAEVVSRDPTCELVRVQSILSAYAPYSDRYAQAMYSRAQLWSAFQCAQFAAASLIRALSSRNQRAVMAAKPAASPT